MNDNIKLGFTFYKNVLCSPPYIIKPYLMYKGYGYYYAKCFSNANTTYFVPDITLVLLTIYCGVTHTNPNPLVKTLMYSMCAMSTLYAGNAIRQIYSSTPDSSEKNLSKNTQCIITLLCLLHDLMYYYAATTHYPDTNAKSNMVKQFLTNNIKIPVGNTDIHFTGGATSIGVQWSSTDDLTDANLTGDADSDSESTTCSAIRL